MNKITTQRFNKILSVVDDRNTFDFDSFMEAIVSTKLNASKDTLDNIIDFLVFDLSISCDADLFQLPQKRLTEIIKGINEILLIDS